MKFRDAGTLPAGDAGTLAGGDGIDGRVESRRAILGADRAAYGDAETLPAGWRRRTRKKPAAPKRDGLQGA